MGSILEALKGPLAGTLEAVEGILGKFITDPQQKLAATVELTKAQNDLTVKIAQADLAWAQAQSDVIKTEAQSASWLTRNWRPMMMLFFGVIIGTVVFTGGYVNGHQLDKDFVLKILDIVQVGLGGYVFGRTAEKIAPKVTEIFAKK